MSAFKEVAVLGVSNPAILAPSHKIDTDLYTQRGNLAQTIIPVLVAAGFNVTNLVRSKKPDDVAPGINSVVVNYTSQADLEAALRGKDVVICALAIEVAPIQTLIIDAAINAGVKRFIPSDFGSVSTDPRISSVGVYVPVVGVQNYIKEKAAQGLIEYTIISPGAFTEMLLGAPLLVDQAGKAAEFWGEGQHRISSTTMAGVGKAIVGALKARSESKNRNLLVHEFVLTQAQVLDLHKKHEPGTEWTITTIKDPKAELEKSEKAMAEEPSVGNAFGVIKATLMSGLFRAYYEKVDNDVVGLEKRSEADLEAILVEIRKKNHA